MSRFEDDFKAIYDSMLGDTKRAPWVRDAWKDDTGFARGHRMLWERRESLAERLGVEDFSEDEDMEAMMYAVEDIQEDLCRRMFYCTIRYARKNFKI